jgi:hypothetical protein
MSNNGVHQCGCSQCKESGSDATRELHAELNAFLGALDEEKRLQFLGLESMTACYGGDQQLELITGVRAVEIAKRRWGIQQTRLGRPAYILESIYAEKKPRETFTYHATKDQVNVVRGPAGPDVGKAKKTAS